MARQLHKIFKDDDFKSLLKRYISKEVKIDYILDVLGIKHSRFFEFLKVYQKDPVDFSLPSTIEK